MKLKDLYELTNFIIRETLNGKSLTPIKFIDLWNKRQINFYQKAYSLYELNKKTTDSLRKFKVIVENIDITVISDSYFNLPSYYAHFIGLNYINDDGKYFPFDKVTKDKAIMRKASVLTAPSLTYPICYEINNKLYLDPYSASIDLKFNYLRHPTSCVLDFYIGADGLPSFLDEDDTHTWSDGETDSSGIEHSAGEDDWDSLTVESEWNDEDNYKILAYILGDVGVSINSGDVYEYANVLKKES